MKGQSQSVLRGSQAGQAVTEYVLVLITVIIVFFLAGGFLRQFNSGFSAWVKNYYGEYLSCLLETGELPTLGYEGGNGGCEDEFQPFTLAGGRPAYNPPRDYTARGGDDDGDGVRDTPKKVDQTDTARADGGARSAQGSDGGSGGASVSAGPQLMTSDSGRARRVPLSAADGGKEQGKTYSQTIAGGGGIGDDGSGGRPSYVPIEESVGRDVTGAGSTGRADDVESRDLSPRRVPADVVAPKKRVEAETGWSLPDFIRLLLIIGIILAMVVFFGGQALQISNGGDN